VQNHTTVYEVQPIFRTRRCRAPLPFAALTANSIGMITIEIRKF
jgi:hypothetical protein